MRAAAEPLARTSRLRERAHWIVGLAGVLGFLCSGLYMRFGLAHVDELDRATRLSFRSIHIYLLFASLLNLAAAPGARPPTRGWAATVAFAGTALLLAAPFLLGAAFVEEPLEPGLDRHLTRLGIYAAAAGTVLLASSRLGPSSP